MRLKISSPKNTQIILNGIPEEQIKKEFSSYSREEARKRFSLPSKREIWGTLSRLSYIKGIDLLLEMPLPQDKLFVIAGDGESREFLLKKMASGKNDNIIFLGETFHPIIFLKSLDGYFSTSRGEGLPLSVLEAMAVGLPCLLSNVEGHQDFSRGAVLFDLENSTDFVEKIHSIDRPSLSRKAKKFVQNNHSMVKMVSQTEELYQSLLA